MPELISQYLQNGYEILFHMRCVIWRRGLSIENQKKTTAAFGRVGASATRNLYDHINRLNYFSRVNRVMRERPDIEISVSCISILARLAEIQILITRYRKSTLTTSHTSTNGNA
jgi:hypothetical protein